MTTQKMTELWDHQRQAVELARTKKNLALLMGMGVGKSRTAIEILREDYNQHRKIRRTLIFAPISVCAQWKSEFAKFAPKLPQDKILVLTGAGATRTKYMRELQDRIVITNYEGLQIKHFYAELLKWSPEIVIADECHRLKSSSSARAKAIYPLAHGADRRFILTGTLFTNSMLDVYGPYRFLDPEIFGHSFWKFRQLYFYDKNAGMPTHRHFPDWQPLPDAVKRISGVIEKTAVQARKEDCLSLPPLIRTVIPIEIKGYQRKQLEMMERSFVAELKGKQVISEFAMTVQLRLRQIIDGFLSSDSKDTPEYFEDNPKIAALADLMDSIGKEKTIIWACFIPSYKQITDLLFRMNIPYVELTGKQSAAEKEIALQKFAGTEAQVLVSNPAAGGVGLNLAYAPYAVYYSKSYNLEHYLQSSARNHRAGSEQFDKVIQYSLQATGTIEEVVEQALENKQDIGRSILNWANKSIEQRKNSCEEAIVVP